MKQIITLCAILIAGTNGNIGCGQSTNFTCKPEPCGSDCHTDLNGDGVTDVGDLLIFIAEYGNTCK